MTITLQAKPLEYEVEIPGYGIFTIRRIGAGAEADLASRMRVIEELQQMVKEEYSDILDEETKLIATKDEKALNTLRSTDRYKEVEKKQAEITKELNSTVEYTKKLAMSLWGSESYENLEKLFNDFTFEQIESLYKQALDQINQSEERK